MMKNLGIRSKLIILVILTAFIPLLCVGFGFQKIAFNSIEQAILNKSETLIEDAASQLETLVDVRHSELGYICRNKIVVDVLRGKESVDALPEVIYPFLAGNRLAFVRLSVYDKERNLLAEISKDGIGETTRDGYMAAIGQLLSRNNYELLMPLNRKMEYWGTKTATKVDGRYDHIIRLTLPINDFFSAEQVGWLQADLQLDAFLFQASVYSLLQNHQVTIVAHDIVVADSDYKKLGASLTQLLPENLFPIRDENGVLYIGTDTKIAFSQVEGLDWIILNWIPLSDYVTEPRQSTKFALFITILIAFATIFVMLAVIGRITGRLRQIVQSAEQLASGNLGQRLKFRSFDETGLLADSFNSMATSLQNNMNQLKDFNRELEDRVAQRVVEVEELSALNIEQERTLRQRMEEELEEAHQLQISMLPNHVPEHPSAEVDWAMKTATEVGGDYYDYRIAADNRLTLVLGDATGHGMQAGTLVTATKSLFQSLIKEENLANTVSKMSQNLKSMNLNRRGMALTLIELNGRQLRYCAAGIPPILIYRVQQNKVEEGQTGGLPLGLTTRGSYQQTEVSLDPGDAVLLMSDGLPERINEAEEEFGYQRVQELFLKVAQETPTEICRRMAAGGDEWAAGKEQDDDVSFVALRVR